MPLRDAPARSANESEEEEEGENDVILSQSEQADGPQDGKTKCRFCPGRYKTRGMKNHLRKCLGFKFRLEDYEPVLE